MDLSRAEWRKSTRSTDTGGDCVELAALPGAVAVRDSKDPGGPVLGFTRASWHTFTEQLKHGRHHA